MTRRILIFAALAAFLIVGTAAAELSKTAPMVNLREATGDEYIDLSHAVPYNPGLTTDSPGDIVGYTFYDYQTNGSSGNRVWVAADGSKYFAWMKLFSWPYPPGIRHVYYNWIDPDGNWLEFEQGYQVSVTAGSGYTNMDLRTDYRGVIAYHQGDFTKISVEQQPGFEIFDHYTPPNQLFPQTTPSPGKCMWPYICVDRTNRIHMVATENTTLRLQRMGYTRSNDGGATWTTFTQVDTVMVISALMAASPVSDRVVLAYAETQDTATQWNNDISYYVSDNGTTWDWRYGKTNVTNYGSDSDSLWAYTDLDVLFDYNDNIHLLWNAQWVTDAGIYYRTDLFHYNEETDQITNILHHPDSLWMDISGAWNRSICKMSLGVEQGSNNLFATWTQFDTSDVSAGGFGNGDLYVSWSTDGGSNWETPINMTDTQTPGCFPGECDSDHWSSLCPVVDDYLHVFYTNDKDAGGIVQTEGAATENPMRYLMFPNPALGVEDNNNRPVNFSLNQNYPNPFNVNTVISFSLKEAGPVSIDVFDITGAKVTTLVDGTMNAGNHEVLWNASDVASGVYYYKLTANNVSETKQAVLIK